MKKDITIQFENGLLNMRVAAIIMKEGKVLMHKRGDIGHMYTVGGRIQFGETSAEAVLREVQEETGVAMEIDHLGFVNENIYVGDSYTKVEQLNYEMCFYYFMKAPDDFDPEVMNAQAGDTDERLLWMDVDTDEKYYPEFFKTELTAEKLAGGKETKYIFTDQRG